MTRYLRTFAIAAPLIVGVAAEPALAEKPGGILKMYSIDSPASMSILEESTAFAEGPMMGVFNNLIMFDQHVKQNSLQSIVPDLATSWSWSEDGTELSLPLRQGVKWHDGKPFTAQDVKCTWDLLMDAASEKLRVNPRKASYRNLDRITTNGDWARRRIFADLPLPRGAAWHAPAPNRHRAVQVRRVQTERIHQGDAQPGLLETGPPVPRRHRICDRQEHIDGSIGLHLGKFDSTFIPVSLTVPLLKDVQSQMPQAICELASNGINRHLLVNREKPPFDNTDLRRAMALSLDRKAFIDILYQGQGEIGGVLQPAPAGLWGMPPDLLSQLPGYDPDVQKNRAQARAIMEQLGYGPDHRLKITVSTRDLPAYRDPAVILIDQLKQVHFDGELEAIDTTNYFPRIRRKDFTVGLSLQTSGPDPDPTLDLFYGCGSNLNWDGYCSPELDSLIERQSREGDPEKRKPLLRAIEKKLAEDAARPIIFYAPGGVCWQPYVKGVTIMATSIFNGNRREDIWLDK